MSYRLIDANAIAESYPEANDMPCIYADLPRGLDGGHYDMREPSELQRENAKLREQVEAAHMSRLLTENENESLRELMADMWPFVEGAMDDECCPAPECPFTELCTENQVCMASSGFHYRMRELGIEV